MDIQFNGQMYQTQSKTLSALLAEQGFEVNSRVATAVNGRFVPKTERDTYELNDDDRVEVVAPMQGG